MESNSKGKRGRPKGMGRSQLEILKDSDTSLLASKFSRTMSPSTTSGSPRQESRAAGTIPKQKDPSSTATRPFFFIVGKAPTSLSMSKLPKSISVLGRLLFLLEKHSLYEASRMVGEEVKAVWEHHFGPKFVLGKEFGKELESVSDEKLKIFKSYKHLAEKVVALYKRWRNLEGDSRRPDRALKPSFLEKTEPFKLRPRSSI
jgi:hypothetical protein